METLKTSFINELTNAQQEATELQVSLHQPAALAPCDAPCDAPCSLWERGRYCPPHAHSGAVAVDLLCFLCFVLCICNLACTPCRRKCKSLRRSTPRPFVTSMQRTLKSPMQRGWCTRLVRPCVSISVSECNLIPHCSIPSLPPSPPFSLPSSPSPSSSTPLPLSLSPSISSPGPSSPVPPWLAPLCNRCSEIARLRAAASTAAERDELATKTLQHTQAELDQTKQLLQQAREALKVSGCLCGRRC